MRGYYALGDGTCRSHAMHTCNSGEPIIFIGMAEPVPMRMNDANALKLLREIAQDSGNVILVDHARKRMRQRKVTTVQIIECLRRGVVSEPVALDIHGNWKLTVAHRVAGKDLNVAVAIDLPSRALVITVF